MIKYPEVEYPTYLSIVYTTRSEDTITIVDSTIDRCFTGYKQVVQDKIFSSDELDLVIKIARKFAIATGLTYVPFRSRYTDCRELESATSEILARIEREVRENDIATV